MVDVTWTDQALADLEATCRYMAHDALRYTGSIRYATDADTGKEAEQRERRFWR